MRIGQSRFLSPLLILERVRESLHATVHDTDFAYGH